MLYAFSCGAGAVADPASVSIQDLKPECMERHPSVPAEHCVIQDRLPSRQYATRIGDTVIVIPAGAPVSAAAAVNESRAAPMESASSRTTR